MDFPPPTVETTTTPPPVKLNGPIAEASAEPMGPAAAVKEQLESEPVKIPLADLVKEEPESKSISFKDSSFLKNHVKAPTSESAAPAAPAASAYEGRSTEELRQQMINEELQPVDEMAPEDFELIAGFLIDAWDIGMVTLFRLYALDNSDTAYEITTGKKNKLKKLLTLILIRFNKKFPLGVLFFMTLIIAHITPAMNAHTHRKETQKLRKKKPKPKPKPERKKPGPKPKPQAPADASEVADSDGDGGGVTAPPIPSKPRGGQSK